MERFHLFEGGSEFTVDSSSVLIGWFWLVEVRSGQFWAEEDDLGSSSSMTSTSSSFVEQGTISGSAGLSYFVGMSQNRTEANQPVVLHYAIRLLNKRG